MSQLGGKMYPSQQQSSQSGASSQQQQFQMQLQQHPLEQWNQALMHQALLQQHQQALFHPGLLAAMSQIEPIASGNLPPGFDAASCRSVYVGNIHPKVSEALLAEVFASMGQLEGYKLIKKEKSSYGFVDYYDHRSAAAAIVNLNGRQIFGQSIKVNWAYASGQREDTTGHYNIFVGDLSPEVTDAVLHSAFSVYRCCSDARVMWDQRTGRSRGFGFVSFRTKQEAERAINEMSGKWLGSRAIRCNWATKNSDIQGDNVQNSTNTLGSAAEESSLAPPVAKHEVPGEQQHDDEGDGPESNPQYTTVYVGNLAHEATQADLHCQFHALGVGIIEEVKVQKEKGFGFVRYRTHEEAAYAIQAANGRVICGKPIKCSWGSKPTPAGTNSSPLPPPQLSAMSFQNIVAAGLNSGISPADLLACQRQLGFAAGDALLPLPQQSAQPIPLSNAAAARAIFESLQPNAVAAAMGQQHLFY